MASVKSSPAMLKAFSSRQTTIDLRRPMRWPFATVGRNVDVARSMMAAQAGRPSLGSLLRFALRRHLIIVAMVLGMSDWGWSAEPLDYDRDVRPILSKHCVGCHGAERHEAGLRLDQSLASLREGGDRGPAVVPGDGGASLLWHAISGDDPTLPRMPPDGPYLSVEDQSRIREWINQGALGSLENAAVTNAALTSAVVTATHWSFQPITAPIPPHVRSSDRTRTPIDRFWLAKLETEALAPSPPADRTVLIRRLSLDLVGLPPAPVEVRAFVADVRPDAYERLVDRLLGSPAFGERWGRHWLDVARYADSNGYTRDSKREMFLYRDWVIQAVNDDVPYDEFLIEQLAGDLLPVPTTSQLVATGFHRNTLTNEEGGTDAEQFRIDAVADRVATTGEAILGLTVGCARCHAHKYDPISQREYYQLFAFFNNCDEPSLEVPSPTQRADGTLARRDAIRQQIAQLETQVTARQAEYDDLQRRWEKAITPTERLKLSTPQQDALAKEWSLRTPVDRQLLKDLFQQSAIAREAFVEIEQIGKLRAEEPSIAQALVFRERDAVRPTHIHRRGNFLDTGREVEPQVPAALPTLAVTGRRPTRLDLAQWLVRDDHPLTARVAVNRVWLHLFGRGLVETENDWGTKGDRPTHPELLDWLAADFQARDWSLKELLRVIVCSEVYRQSSTARDDVNERDPQNRWLARQSRLRLEAEIVRDSALAVSQLLTRILGGPSVFPPQPDGVFQFTQDPKPWNTRFDATRYRRGMYTHFWRSSPYPSLSVFDFPNSNVTCTSRLRSNTPLQSLTLANDLQFVECARAMAQRVQQPHDLTVAQRVERIVEAALCRPARAEERSLLEQYYRAQRESFAQRPADVQRWLAIDGEIHDEQIDWAAWTSVARVVLNVDEFITRE